MEKEKFVQSSIMIWPLVTDHDHLYFSFCIVVTQHRSSAPHYHKLVRQMLVQKERGFIHIPCDLDKLWTSVTKNLFSFCSSSKFLLRQEERAFSYLVTFLAFHILLGVLSIHFSSFLWALGPYPLICLALGALSVRTSTCHHLDQWGRLPNILTVYANTCNPIVSHEIKLLDD